MAMVNRAELLTEGPYGRPAAGGRGRSSTRTGRSTASPKRGAYAGADIGRGRATWTETTEDTEAAKGKTNMELNIVDTAEHNGLIALPPTTPPKPLVYKPDT